MQIQDVWFYNLEEELDRIRNLVEEYPIIAMVRWFFIIYFLIYLKKDTEFPGVISRPLGPFKTQTDFQYKILKLNVDLLNIIQLGLTFSNEKGQLPDGVATWQFHFKFSLEYVLLEKMLLKGF